MTTAVIDLGTPIVRCEGIIMRITEILAEGWSQKYKKSINCSHPKGFSQKAHCAGKKKNESYDVLESTCPDCGMCQSHGSLTEMKKGQKDSNGYTKCWPGKHAEGTKKGKNGGQVRNCVPNESIEEAEGTPSGVPHLTKELLTHIVQQSGKEGAHAVVKSLEWGDGAAKELLHKIVDDLKDDIKQDKFANETLEHRLNSLFDTIEEYVDAAGLSEDVYDTYTDEQLISESAAWHRKAGKNKNGGLNRKGVMSYRREHPGSHLQTAVTTKPSKLKPGSKAAKRRKSFCARMGGSKGPMKKPNGEPTRKALALRKWHC